MKKSLVIKIVIDVMMTLILLFLMGYQFFGESNHEWAGMVMFVLFIGHHLLNRNWYRGLFKGQMTLSKLIRISVIGLLLITMFLQMYSGIVMSRYVFGFLGLNGGLSLARRLHILGAYWGFILMAVHLGMHWNMVINLLKKQIELKVNKRFLFIISLIIAGYGLFVFIDRNFLTYLFLQSEFVFFDFQEPVLLFYLDYLSLMGLGIFIGHYGFKWLQKR